MKLVALLSKEEFKVSSVKCPGCGFANTEFRFICQACCKPTVPLTTFQARDDFSNEIGRLVESLDGEDDPRFDALIETMQSQVGGLQEQVGEAVQELEGLRNEAGISSGRELESDKTKRRAMFWTLVGLGIVATVWVSLYFGIPDGRYGIYLAIGLAAAFALAFWVENKTHTKCPSCREKSPRKKSFQYQDDMGYEDGWHTETRTANTTTQHRDRQGHQSGSSDSTTYYQVTVPHRTFYYRNHFKCMHCAYHWYSDFSRRVNL